jgi:hypothetical protein
VQTPYDELNRNNTIEKTNSAGGIIQGAAKEVPAWQKAIPGTHTFLGDDGGGVETATVRDTADHYRDWLRSEHPSGCQTFQGDLPIVLEVITFDPGLDRVGDCYEPIAKIQLSSRNFTGYKQLLGIHPVIPAGTVVRYKREGNDTLRLFLSAKIQNKDQGSRPWRIGISEGPLL